MFHFFEVTCAFRLREICLNFYLKIEPCLMKPKTSEVLETFLLSFQVVQEYERAVIFRLGRLLSGGSRGPGKFWIILIMLNDKLTFLLVSFQSVNMKHNSGDFANWNLEKFEECLLNRSIMKYLRSHLTMVLKLFALWGKCNASQIMRIVLDQWTHRRIVFFDSTYTPFIKVTK